MKKPYLSRLGRNDVTPEVGAIYDHFQRQRGNVPNMFRTIAHRPEILQTMIAHFQAVLNTGTVPLKLKELLIVRTSQINDCEYCLASHSIIAKKLGWTQQQIDTLADFETSPDYTPAEKAALRLAEAVTHNAHPLPEKQFDELRSFFDEGEIVELMAAVGLFNYFNRFNNALLMEPTV